MTTRNYPQWLTPAIYVESARLVLGSIDLDPASCLAAQATVKATTFYTEQDSGLDHDWCGRVWLNPPYDRRIAAFVAKLLLHLDNGDVSRAILMSNPRTDSGWWQAAARASSAICFMSGRMKSRDENGVLGGSPTSGHTFLNYGEASAFIKEFSQYGFTLKTK